MTEILHVYDLLLVTPTHNIILPTNRRNQANMRPGVNITRWYLIIQSLCSLTVEHSFSLVELQLVLTKCSKLRTLRVPKVVIRDNHIPDAVSVPLVLRRLWIGSGDNQAWSLTYILEATFGVIQSGTTLKGRWSEWNHPSHGQIQGFV